MFVDFDENDVNVLRESGLFDIDWYLNRYPDVAELGIDPIVHYLELGAALGRDPSPKLSSTGYLKANPDVAAAGINPLVHYAISGRYEVRQVPPADGAAAIWSPPQVEFVPQKHFDPLPVKQARLIAFYLPQFHPIPENDKWWGKGFTEWTNVRPASSQFVGHYQPHVPHPDIGYYSLNDTQTQRKQIELAKIYGIEAFCFYYYWFAGKRLLESPLEAWLNDPTLDHPFCVCWANENWSRRWDGSDAEILMAQEHSPTDDINCIADIARYLRDPRYLRIDGKPLLLIYRPAILPFPKETAERWRQWCRDNGIGEIFLACTQSFGQTDLDAFGLDAAVEFPPNNSSPTDITGNVLPLRGDFEGRVYDWTDFVRRSEAYPEPSYRLFRSVCPGWDNTARRKTRGAIFVNNTPALYERWLENAVADTIRTNPNPQERLVFVNAWNEWAEGAHLEPDMETGFAYLEATRRAIAGWQPGQAAPHGKIALVCHDAYHHGAQYLSLNIARSLSKSGYEVHTFLLDDGPLKDAFREVGYLHDLSGHDPHGPYARRLVRELRDLGAQSVICNTLVSAIILPLFKEQDYRIISLIHEMPDVIRQHGLENSARSVVKLADKVIFASQPVADAFAEFAPLSPENHLIRPQGLYKINGYRRQKDGIASARRALRQHLEIAPDAPVILGVGYADARKGVDLFVEAGLEILKQLPSAIFIWIGHDAQEWTEKVHKAVEDSGKSAHFLFPGLVQETNLYYAGADIFALTSREDPFPSVVLEAMDCGLPVVAFAQATGMDALITACDGLLVPRFDTRAYAKAIIALLASDEHRQACEQKSMSLIDRDFVFDTYVQDLLIYLGEKRPTVSVIVPNYNYENYIRDRLQTIVDQDYTIYEIIVLDDKSTDNSVEVIREFLSGCNISARLVVNRENSGSVFRQWQRGLELAKGDLVWIAEADDLAHPSFLTETVAAFEDPAVVISYCQSRQIDAHGIVTANDYLDYVSDLDAARWTRPYKATGREEIASALFMKNTIPNASGAVFRRSVLQDVLTQHGEEIISYRNAGDWVAYLRLLERGSIAFTPKALNDHRRHADSVTIGNANQRHYDEIVAVQSNTIERHNLGQEATTRATKYAAHIADYFNLI
ncbi:glycoside hydrolase family 99-like domain-containing protein [Sphingobium agri]|uniref:Glycoside hydrolase family 99-like domain-containing protein n=1 Tax=Sphingobium agri TaxID=2933566 RepID=A0ABT0E1S6_9SPHN|nr:glycoside hydrolase family 99-like domain-containing protein [Sphingobium agri]MCK0533329.1 glycoside hydrolase family 99-like domain-containing protein [Sphingobium agri]